MSALPRLTLAALAAPERIDEFVGASPSPRWFRGALDSHGEDETTKYEWLSLPTEERVRQVLEALQDPEFVFPARGRIDVLRQPVLPRYLRGLVPGREPGRRTRPIQMAHPVGQGVEYVIADALSPHIEERLSKAAMAYRPGRNFLVGLRSTILEARTKGLHSVVTIDISDFYEVVDHGRLDALVDTLDADDAVKTLIKKSYASPRRRGLPQGGALGPILINLYLARFDQRIQSKLGKIGILYRRYCDDIALFAKLRTHARAAIAVLRAELQRLGLDIKPGTDRIHNLKDPENLPTWLGITFSVDDAWASPEKLRMKVREILHEREQGHLDDEGVELRLRSLRCHYDKLLHPRRTDEAIAFLRRILNNHYGYPRKEDISHRIESWFLRTQSKMRSKGPVQVRPKGPEQEEHPRSGSSAPPLVDPDAGISLMGSNDSMEGRNGSTQAEKEEKEEKEITSSSEKTHGDQPHGYPKERAIRRESPLGRSRKTLQRGFPGRSFLSPPPSPAQGPSLSSYLEASSSRSLVPGGLRTLTPITLDPVAHQGVRENKITVIRAAVERPWVIRAMRDDAAWVIQADCKDGRSHRLPLPWGRSPAHRHLLGLAAVLRVLGEDVPLACDVVISEPTLVGHLEGNQVRRPHLRDAWMALRREVLRAEARGGLVALSPEAPDRSGVVRSPGRRTAWQEDS